MDGRLKTPAHDRHTSSTLQLNPEFDLTSFSLAEEGDTHALCEDTDGDDEDTFFKSRRNMTGSSAGSRSRYDSSKKFAGVDMEDVTIER